MPKTSQEQICVMMINVLTCLWFDISDGLYLIEVDRVLRPGGYWIISGPPINWKKHYRGWERTQEDLKKEQDSIEEVAKRLCWRKVIEKDDLAIWQKPTNHIECKESQRINTTPHFCKDGNADAGWYEQITVHIMLVKLLNHIKFHNCGSKASSSLSHTIVVFFSELVMFIGIRKWRFA